MENNEQQVTSWDLLRWVLSVVAMLAAGGASLSARLILSASEKADAQLERRIMVMENQINIGILPRSDERFMQIQRDIARLEARINQYIDGR